MRADSGTSRTEDPFWTAVSAAAGMSVTEETEVEEILQALHTTEHAEKLFLLLQPEVISKGTTRNRRERVAYSTALIAACARKYSGGQPLPPEALEYLEERVRDVNKKIRSNCFFLLFSGASFLSHIRKEDAKKLGRSVVDLIKNKKRSVRAATLNAVCLRVGGFLNLIPAADTKLLDRTLRLVFEHAVQEGSTDKHIASKVLEVVCACAQQKALGKESVTALLGLCPLEKLGASRVFRALFQVFKQDVLSFSLLGRLEQAEEKAQILRSNLLYILSWCIRKKPKVQRLYQDSILTRSVACIRTKCAVVEILLRSLPKKAEALKSQPDEADSLKYTEWLETLLVSLMLQSPLAVPETPSGFPSGECDRECDSGDAPREVSAKCTSIPGKPRVLSLADLSAISDMADGKGIDMTDEGIIDVGPPLHPRPEAVPEDRPVTLRTRENGEAILQLLFACMELERIPAEKAMQYYQKVYEACPEVRARILTHLEKIEAALDAYPLSRDAITRAIRCIALKSSHDLDTVEELVKHLNPFRYLPREQLEKLVNHSNSTNFYLLLWHVYLLRAVQDTAGRAEILRNMSVFGIQHEDFDLSLEFYALLSASSGGARECPQVCRIFGQLKAQVSAYFKNALDIARTSRAGLLEVFDELLASCTALTAPLRGPKTREYCVSLEIVIYNGPWLVPLLLYLMNNPRAYSMLLLLASLRVPGVAAASPEDASKMGEYGILTEKTRRKYERFVSAASKVARKESVDISSLTEASFSTNLVIGASASEDTQHKPRK